MYVLKLSQYLHYRITQNFIRILLIVYYMVTNTDNRTKKFHLSTINGELSLLYYSALPCTNVRLISLASNHGCKNQNPL